MIKNIGIHLMLRERFYKTLQVHKHFILVQTEKKIKYKTILKYITYLTFISSNILGGQS